MGKQHKEETATEQKKVPPPPANVNTNDSDELEAFANLSDDELDEGTSQYVKFTEPGQVVNGRFVKLDHREFKEGEGERECVILKTPDGQALFAQSIIVNEIKKHWDLRKEAGFMVRIKYMGLVKAGTPDQYQNFRLLFEPVKQAQ